MTAKTTYNTPTLEQRIGIYTENTNTKNMKQPNSRRFSKLILIGLSKALGSGPKSTNLQDQTDPEAPSTHHIDDKGLFV